MSVPFLIVRLFKNNYQKKEVIEMKKINEMNKFFKDTKLKIASLSAGTAIGTVVAPVGVAYADTAGEMMTNIAGILSSGLIVAGAAMIVWGGVNVGMAIKDGASGNQLQQGIMWIVGGVVVAAAGAYFKSIDWNIG